MPSIVIVDDRVTNRRILSRLASEFDSKPDVETFGDPVLALEWLERNEPDLVITAYQDKGFRYETLNADATDFLLSPVDHEKFRARGRNLLTLRYQQCLLKRRAAHGNKRQTRNDHIRKQARRGTQTPRLRPAASQVTS